MLAPCPLLKVVWLKIYKFRFYINLATFSPGRCNESRVSNSQITTVDMESLRTCNQLSDKILLIVNDQRYMIIIIAIVLYIGTP